MGADLISTWPNIRLNPTHKERLRRLLEKAGDRASLILRVNELIGEALDQIESTADRLEPLPTVKRLREATGRFSGTELGSDLASILARLEALEKSNKRNR